MQDSKIWTNREDKERHKVLKKNNQENDSDHFENISEQEIWNAFRQGNEDAFIHIYIKYFKVLYQYASQFSL
ncbi:hypothetical protein E1171_10545, partial [Cytophagales bacterium RKSG123]|nr:hypothetical protein [Xanthovirga aplysinae]